MAGLVRRKPESLQTASCPEERQEEGKNSSCSRQTRVLYTMALLGPSEPSLLCQAQSWVLKCSGSGSGSSRRGCDNCLAMSARNNTEVAASCPFPDKDCLPV